MKRTKNLNESVDSPQKLGSDYDQPGTDKFKRTKKKTILRGTGKKAPQKMFSRYQKPSETDLKSSTISENLQQVDGFKKRPRLSSNNSQNTKLVISSPPKLYTSEVVDLETKESVIFTFTHEIKQNSFIVVPFKISLNKEALVSYNHSIDPFLVDFICLQRDRKFRKFKHPLLRSQQCSKEELGKSLLQENNDYIKLEYELTGYYATDKAHQESREAFAISEFENLQNSKFFLHHTQEVQVVNKNDESDFCKYTKIIKLPRMPESLIKKFCCLCFPRKKISKIQPKKIEQEGIRPILNEGDIFIALEKLVFRTIDKSINCVINYKNSILKQYDYMDILLTAKYKIRHLKISDKLSSVLQKGSPLHKKRSRKLNALSRGYLQKFSSISKTFQSKTKVSSTKVVVVKNLPPRHSSKTIVNQVTMHSEDQRNREIDDQNDPATQIFEKVIYSDSVDLLGKRVIDLNESSEIVYRVELNRDELGVTLESIQSEFLECGFFLSFYLSTAPLSFTKLASCIPIKFTNVPKQYRSVGDENVSGMMKYLRAKTDKNQSSFILPFANIKFDLGNEVKSNF